MLIATKFEEIYPPTIKELIKVASKRFSADDLLDMESEVVSELQFELMVPTGLPFLYRFLFLSKASEMTRKASKFYLERLLLEHDSLNEPPSLLAVACVCLALNHPQIRTHDGNLGTSPGIVSRNSRVWTCLTLRSFYRYLFQPSILCQYTGYGCKAIRRVAKYVARAVSTPLRVKSNNLELNAVFRKHSSVSRLFSHPDADDISRSMPSAP